MKSSIATLLLFLTSAAAFSQQPVKVNLLEYFDKVLPPPVTAKEAYDKCGCNVLERTAYAKIGDCTADSLFKRLTDDLGKIQLDISTPATGTQGDLMRKMQDPEFQKKMESMSEDEKMKLAMEIQAENTAMVTGPMKPEPRTVTAALKEMGKLNETNVNDLQNLNANVQAEMQHQQEVEAKHNAVNDWEAAEIKKLPIINSGGESDGAPDPKAVYSVTVNAFKKHFAIVEAELARTGKSWGEQRSKSKQLFTPYETSLEKTHYGDDAKNKITKSTLSTGQTLMIGAISNLIRGSQTAYNAAADWYDRYVQYQKQYQNQQ
jgi:hypothetical protein